jgi:hypothetical protein
MTLSRLLKASTVAAVTLAASVTGLAQKKVAPVQQWEYTYLQLCEGALISDGGNRLQELGDQGWEIVTAVNSTCLFKRPKREGSYPKPRAEQPQPAPKCNLTLAQAPVVRGLRLGMSLSELLALFPVSRYNTSINQEVSRAEKLPELGEATLSFGLHQYPEGEDRFAGVSQVGVTIFDRKVVSFTIQYKWETEAQWTVESWIRKLAEAFNLPGSENWVRACERCHEAALNCGGLKIEVSLYPNRVILTAPSYQEEIRRRAKAIAEKKQGEFKP